MNNIIKTFQSQNYESRRNRAINMLVIHATAGNARSALNWMCSRLSRVSAHYLIDKQGAIYQLVNENYAAWHAGKSQWLQFNSTDIMLGSIGIELENANNGDDPYPMQQQYSLIDLSREIIKRHNIDLDMVVRHSDIAIPKGRKSDPSGFPWQSYKKSLAFVPQVVENYRIKKTILPWARVRQYPTTTSSVIGRLLPTRKLSGVRVPGEDRDGLEWIKITTGGFVREDLIEIDN